VTWCSCFPMIAQWRSSQKSGAHLSQLFNMGWLVVSWSSCPNNLFKVCSYLWSHINKVWRVLMWRWWCSFSLSNLDFWWWPLSLVQGVNQPLPHGPSSWTSNLNHFGFFTIVNFSHLSCLLSCRLLNIS
jgi:hypothetical protein